MKSAFEGELHARPEGWCGLGFACELVDELLKDNPLVGGRGAELRIGAGDEAEGAGELAAGFVASGLADQIIGGEGGHAEALPQGLPDGARVADILFQNHKHLAEGTGEHVEVADG